MVYPENSSDPSPDHSITICNSSTDAHCCAGPSFALADWRSASSPTRNVWQCLHTHSSESTLLAYLFPRLHQNWLTYCSFKQAPFGDAVRSAFSSFIKTHTRGVAARLLPPHSLAVNALHTLLLTFLRSGLVVEGFGYGSGWAALTGILGHQSLQLSSLLISLGGLALHIPSACRPPLQPISHIPQSTRRVCQGGSP